jgi:hypothetical protein
LVRLHARLLHPDPRGRMPSAEHALALLTQWDGYRNGAEDLGRLVRSMVVGEREATSFTAAPTRILTKPAVIEPASGVDPDATRTFIEAALKTGQTQPSVRLTTPAVGRPHAPVMKVVTVGLVFGMIGMVLGWWIAQPEADRAVPSSPILDLGSQVAIVSSTELEAERSASVEFVLASGVAELDAKVGDRVLALGSTRTVKLKPGRQEVYTRRDGTQSWQRAGTIELEAGRGYEIELGPDRISVVDRGPIVAVDPD